MRALFGRTELDEAARQALRDGSPLRRVHPGLPPFLLVHGTADMSVPYEQSVRMQKALRDAGVACDLITVPDGTHGTRDWDERLPGWADQVVAWLARGSNDDAAPSPSPRGPAPRAAPLAAQDRRRRHRAGRPPACATLEARLTAPGGLLSEADEARPDTARIQAAIDACPAGRAVRLDRAAAPRTSS